jgi:hypothetical protein
MSSQPPNLYLDHSALAREDWWPIIAPAVSAGDVRLAFSLWNLVEIGDAKDLAQRERRLTFIEQNAPLWIVERVGVQRQEVRRFLWTNRFSALADELCVFTPHLSVVDGYLVGAHAQVGLAARSFIARTDFSAIAEKKKLAPAALSTLQAVGRKAFKMRQRDIFRPGFRD